MLNRECDFALKNGDLSISSDGYKWIGGSPVKLDANGQISGNIGQCEFFRVGYHNYDYDKGTTGLCTYITPPAILTLEKSTEVDIAGKEYADVVAPWDEAVTTYAVGDLLRPTTQTSGGTTYACWTNAAYADLATGSLASYPAKIRSMVGSGASVTSITIELGNFTIMT